MAKTTAKVWTGAESLRRSLVPIESLEPFPDNPRRSDVELVRKSLVRFGQVRPVLVDGTRIIAGHHVVQAAAAEGWTHVAVNSNAFENDEEARAYLLADNGIPAHGGFDQELLAAQLGRLRDLTATGYSSEDRRELEERLAHLRSPQFPESEEVPSLDQRTGTTGLFEVPLLLDRDSRKDFANLVGMLKREWSLDDTEAVILRALRDAAART